MLQRITAEISLNFSIIKIVYNDSYKFIVSWRGIESCFNIEILKLVLFIILYLHIVHQDHLYP